MRVKISGRWVRTGAGGSAVVDSRAPLLFWEDAFPVPSYAFAGDSVRTDLLVPAAHAPARGVFFLPKGPVSEWFDLHVDGRVLAGSAWTRDDPAVSDRMVFSWQPSVMDRWPEKEGGPQPSARPAQTGCCPSQLTPRHRSPRRRLPRRLQATGAVV